MRLTSNTTSLMSTRPSPLTSAHLGENTTNIFEFGRIFAVSWLFSTELVISNPLRSTRSKWQSSLGVKTKVFSSSSKTVTSPMSLTNSVSSLMVTLPWSEQAMVKGIDGLISLILANLFQSGVD